MAGHNDYSDDPLGDEDLKKTRWVNEKFIDAKDERGDVDLAGAFQIIRTIRPVVNAITNWKVTASIIGLGALIGGKQFVENIATWVGEFFK